MPSPNLSFDNSSRNVQHETEHEFGRIGQAIKPVEHEHSSQEDLEIPVNLRNSQERVAAHGKPYTPTNKYKLLCRRLVRPRWLRQYFIDGQLVREVRPRKVKEEELFLDLILVANVAVLGHELRVSDVKWVDVEKFILLFGVIWSSWKNFAFLWNLFSSHPDLLEKGVVALAMFALSGVGVSAHAIFTSAKNYGAVFSTFSILIPSIAQICFSAREPILRGANNMFNAGVFTGLINALSSLVYLLALAVPRGHTTGLAAVYWIGLALNIFATPIAGMTYRRLHKKRSSALHVAVNIEAIVEKNVLLTLIVTGESLLSILFEGADIIGEDNITSGNVYYSAFLGVLIAYCFMTLYVNIDNLIHKGGSHAIRARPLNGYIWANLHFVHQMGLIFTATGIGQALRTAALNSGDTIGDSEKMLLQAIRASAGGKIERKDFTRAHSYLFAAGFAIVLLASASLSALHHSGPRAATKWYRLTIRVIVTLALTIGLPLWNGLRLLAFESIFAFVLAAITTVEFILVEMDRLGWWRDEGAPDTSQYISSDVNSSSDFLDDISDSYEGEEANKNIGQEAKKPHVDFNLLDLENGKSTNKESIYPEDYAQSSSPATDGELEKSASERKSRGRSGRAVRFASADDRTTHTDIMGPIRGHERSQSIGNALHQAENSSTGTPDSPPRMHRRAKSMFPPDIQERLHRNNSGLDPMSQAAIRRARSRITRRMGGERRRFELLSQGDKGAASCIINR